MVRMVSSSAGEGPGPLISRGFTERRIFRRSIASGTGASFVGERSRDYHGDWLATRQGGADLGRLGKFGRECRPPARVPAFALSRGPEGEGRVKPPLLTQH